MSEASTAMLDQAWRLSPSAALRPEPFGALAYHFGNRRLTFLKRRDLVDVVRSLADHRDVRSALTAAGVPEAQWPAYVAALQGLAEADLIRPDDSMDGDSMDGDSDDAVEVGEVEVPA